MCLKQASWRLLDNMKEVVNHDHKVKIASQH